MVKNEQYLHFCALGGLEEIGLNCSVYGYGNKKQGDLVVIDLGLTFPDQEHAPGTSIVVPDITWLVKNRDRIKGLIITHAHEDHIGAIAYLWQELLCPIYASPFTAAVIREKVARNGKINSLIIKEVPNSKPFQLGDFSCRLLNITHSVPEAKLVELVSPAGRIVHSGDWKFDDEPLVGKTTDYAALDAMGEDGVLALMCDSTNVLEEGHSGSEVSVMRELIKQTSQIKKGRIVITHFSSNVARFAIAHKIAKKTGRKICVCGGSFNQFVRISKKHGLLPDLETVDEKTAANLPPEKLLLLCSGSQGELNSSMTSLAYGKLRHLRLEKGDTVIYSNRVIPGNEPNVFRIYNVLAEKGINIHTVEDYCTHVSGHPCQDELKEMYRRLKPQILVPIHGDAYHIRKQLALASECKIPETFFLHNGDLLALSGEQKGHLVGKIATGREYVSGNLRLNQESPAFGERKRLMHKGIVHISLNFNDEGYIRGYADVAIYGVCDNKNDLVDGLILLMEKLVPARTSHRQIKMPRLQETVKKYLYNELGFSPLVHFALNQ